MNYRQLQYAIRLADARNFSTAARQLGISQPALSKQVSSLEEDLGVTLFDRGTSPLSLTPAGEAFIRQARDMVFMEDKMRATMQDYRSGERGRLVIGSSPFRSLYMMPDIVLALTQRFPGLDVVLEEGTTTAIHKAAAEGRYDLAIVNLPVDQGVLEVIPLAVEHRMLAVPVSMVDRLSPTETDEKYPLIDLADCTDLPFISFVEGSETRRMFDDLCRMASLHPKVCAEATGITGAWALARAGVGATLLADRFLEHDDFAEGLRAFRLKQNAFIKQPVIVTQRGQHLSPYAKAAIELLCAQE